MSCVSGSDRSAVTVWTGDTAPWPGPPFEQLLNGGELARARRFRFDDDRKTFVIAHALMRLALAAHLGVEPNEARVYQRCPQCGGEHGKPRAPGAQLSLSHSGTVVAVAVSGRPVGVDVERRRPEIVTTDLLTASFGERDLPTLLEAPAGRRADLFFGAWTTAEAVAKMGDIRSIGARSLSLARRPRTERFLPHPGYFGAVAWAGATASVTCLPARALLDRAVGPCETIA